MQGAGHGVHRPVLLAEVVDLLAVRSGGTYLDGTAGSGGYAAAILARAGEGGFVLAVDRDPAALERTRARLSACEGRWVAVHGNYADMGEIAARHGVRGVDGVVLDLGVSSEQLEDPARGFSFLRDGPLDMRMDPGCGGGAEAIVNTFPEDRLADLLAAYGEEPRARAIACAIARARQERRLTRTGDLARLVEGVWGGRRGPAHPATRTFQALRIAVNGELDALAKGLEAGLGLLAPGGRMAVVTFHSLEDRIVKRCFAAHAGRRVSLQQGGDEWQGALPPVRRVTRKAVVAGPEEVALNARARSAKLRVVERLAAA